MPKKDLIKKIKKEIKDSGFPLEIFVIDICSKKNTGRMPNQRYTYEGELKEIDLHAFFEEIDYNTKKTPQHTSSNLIIECKKSRDKPWVFFSSPMFANSDSFSFLKYLSSYDSYFSKKKKHKLLGRIWKNIKKNHYLDRKIPKCISYFEAFKNPSQESKIYEAIQSVLSFMKYDMHHWLNKSESKYEAVTDFYYPIIVLDGGLFEANVKNGKTKVIERKHIQIRTLLDGEIYIIDVIKKEYFKKFLNKLEENHKEVVREIKKLKISKEHKKKILEQNKKTLKNFKLDFPLDYYVFKK